jgi:hypothetical protein
LAAAILVCLERGVKTRRISPALVKLESKRPQHAVHGLLCRVAKVKEEAEDTTVVSLCEMIQHSRAKNRFSASREPMQP